VRNKKLDGDGNGAVIGSVRGTSNEVLFRYNRWLEHERSAEADTHV